MRTALTRRALTRPALTLALLLALAAPGLAQAPTDQDLEALRFYTGQGDEVSAEAELRRLRSQFPGWTPPENLAAQQASQPSTEIDLIYRRIADGDVAGAQRTIAETRKSFPGWAPPTEMEQLLSITEAQQGFDAAVAAGQAQQAIAIVRGTPALLRCDRVNNAWKTAEMQVALADSGGALATYRGVLSACTGFAEIVATLEKASAIATPAQMQELFALVRPRFASNAAALDTLEARLLGTAPAAAASAAPPPRRAAAAAPAAPAPRAAAPAASGGALPRQGDGRLAATRSAAQSGAWAECLARSANPGSAELAYERAWCAYNLDRPAEALAGFAQMERARLSPELTRDARFGMALSYLDQNMTENAAQIAAATDFTREQRLTIESIILNQRGVRAYERKDYHRAIAFLDAMEEMGKLTRDLAILRAYAYLNLDQRAEAHRQFETLHRQLATRETRAGMAASR
ncbi:hypothetical protein GCM10011341_05120 [Frigidibacter albus]|uniref:Tetratricopeptide repeat protein n=1 Tax=Frigidibacter albus TaxID=1465486 RepID=A0A6L8VE48_9RHOB|nr:hypothetical protein [Frigidibacter albus]MZQ88444.1 hypothetical protein [Frigidibacter albus]GGH45309.1 hypothetical protein GCM10011341_05120 [Frigidibacter albus]